MTRVGSFLIISVLSAVAAGQAYGQEGGQPPAVPPQTEQQKAPETPDVTPRPVVPVRAYLRTGTAHYRIGEYEEALEDLTKARVQEPQSAEAAYYLGMTYKKVGDVTKAAENYKDAVKLQPPFKEAFIELADAYYALGRYDEVLFILEVMEHENIEPAQTAFLRGLVLSKQKKYIEALTAFEKAKRLDPKLSTTADFQIATIYNRQGKTAEALGLYRAIAAQEPNSSVGEMAMQQVEVMTAKPAQKSLFHAAAEVQFQHDSNVILKPDAASSATNISGQSDTSTVVSLRTEYLPVLPMPYELKLQYSLYLNTYAKLKSYDVQSHTIGVAPAYRIGENTARLQVNWNDTLLDNAAYLQSLSLSPLYLFITGEGHYAQASLWYQKKDYQQTPSLPDEDRSGNDVGAGISWFKLIAEKKGFLNLKYELNKESTTGVNWSYLGQRIYVGSLYPVTEKMNVSASLDVYFQNYTNTNTSYNVKRNDTSYTANVQGLYAVTQAIDLQLQYTYNKNVSSISVYGYGKNVYGIGLNAKF